MCSRGPPAEVQAPVHLPPQCGAPDVRRWCVAVAGAEPRHPQQKKIVGAWVTRAPKVDISDSRMLSCLAKILKVRSRTNEPLKPTLILFLWNATSREGQSQVIMIPGHPAAGDSNDCEFVWHYQVPPAFPLPPPCVRWQNKFTPLN